MGVWVRSPPPALTSFAQFTSRAVLRHAAFGATRLELAGTTPAPGIRHASVVQRSQIRSRGLLASSPQRTFSYNAHMKTIEIR
jgi:hypothetical protein